MKNTVLFDLDGTLVNSLFDLCDSTNYMLNELDLPERSIEEVREFVGNGIDMLIRRAVGSECFDFEKAMRLFREYYNTHLTAKTIPYEGILNVVDTLKSKGFKLGVVTNKAQDAAESIVNYYFKDKFDIVVGADLKKRRKKPEPDGVELALCSMESNKKNAIFVGDSEVDIATAKNAGLDFIGVTWGFRSRDIFADTVHIAEKTEELISLCCNFL